VSRAIAVAATIAAMVWANPAAAKTPLRPGERIDLNRATLTELMRLPNVGRKRAEAIMAHRGRKPFRRVEELAKVKGISGAWIARNRAVLAVSDAGAPASGPARSH
jgi:competence protein ComEA